MLSEVSSPTLRLSNYCWINRCYNMLIISYHILVFLGLFLWLQGFVDILNIFWILLWSKERPLRSLLWKWRPNLTRSPEDINALSHRYRRRMKEFVLGRNNSIERDIFILSWHSPGDSEICPTCSGTWTCSSSPSCSETWSSSGDAPSSWRNSSLTIWCRRSISSRWVGDLWWNVCLVT